MNRRKTSGTERREWNQPKAEPTPEEIRQACWEIQAGWTPEEERRRAAWWYERLQDGTPDVRRPNPPAWHDERMG